MEEPRPCTRSQRPFESSFLAPREEHGPCLDRGFSAKLSEFCLAVLEACLVRALPARALLALVNGWLHLQG